MFIPSYISLHRNGVLRERIAQAATLLNPCRSCPRKCGANRLEDQQGYCRTGRKARVASLQAHFEKEAPLVGSHGSGAIFFSSCNLLCSFCQNYDISHLNEGADVESAQLAAMMLNLQSQGCHNINFITPSHVVPQILEALAIAIEQGLKIPLVYNSGGYDSMEVLLLLEGIFDIYVPDFKFWDKKWAQKYSTAPDYREHAIAAIKEMYRQVGDLQLDENGIAMRGLLIRHLVLPNNVAGTQEVLNFIANEISVATYVNLMSQYRPCGIIAFGDDAIGRPLHSSELTNALTAAYSAGLTRLDR
jgi:putative pyruvate formate lyase activating enzyme